MQKATKVHFCMDNNRTLISHVLPNQKIILVSSLYKGNQINPNLKELEVSIITFNNKTKRVVDNLNLVHSTYTVNKNIRKWPMVIFFIMLNTNCIDSHKPIEIRIFTITFLHEIFLGEIFRSVKLLEIFVIKKKNKSFSAKF